MNDYLRIFCSKYPWFGVKLRVYDEEDEEIRNEKIIVNKKAIFDQGDQTESPGRIG